MDLPLSEERAAATLGDLIADPASHEDAGPIAGLINDDLVSQLLSKLPEREQKVLKMRFGLEDKEFGLRGGERKTLREIGGCDGFNPGTYPPVGNLRDCTIA